MNAGITRRDFVNALLAGSGASLLGMRAPWAAAPGAPPSGAPGPHWYGYGGVGDYAASHGNTPQLVADAHAIRHGAFDAVGADWVDTGETYALIVVGGGLAGLGAAYEFREQMPASARCLVIDNHPMFGGEAKQNEFEVGGYRLTAPQGSNGFSVPPRAGGQEDAYAVGDAYYYERLGVPREFSYSEMPPDLEPLRFGKDNYGFLWWLQDRIDVSRFYPGAGAGGAGVHVVNAWENGLREAPVPEAVRAAMIEAATTHRRPYAEERVERWADTMSCKDYLEGELGLHPAVTAWLDPIVASAVGSACDATSAYVLWAIGLPGFKGYHDIEVDDRHSFPGGNTGFARYFLKRILPEGIAGGDGFADIMNGRIRFERLDRPGQMVRLRLAATAVHVAHDQRAPERSDWVHVSYVKDGRVQRVKARAVVMAGGGWVNKHVVRDLPEAHRRAYDSFNHAAFLVANVAVTSWEFLYALGVTGCLYEGDFGFSCNIRRPMIAGDRRMPLDPRKPATIQFYVPFYTPGESPAMQGHLGRMALFTTSFADYERRIVAQLEALFGATGFDARRHLAGIILNRWGHAYVMPEPGFFFGRDGEPPAREVVSRRHGRIAFGHSELRGLQHWGPAAAEGRRAFRQLRAVL